MPIQITQTQLEILEIDRKARAIAHTMYAENNEEQIELSVKSSDKIHRIAAVFYYQQKMDPNPCLLNLLGDQDPLVVEAAHIACIIIANNKKHKDFNKYPKGHLIDFGPWLNRLNNQSEGTGARQEAIDMWQSHFDKILKNKKEIEDKPKEEKKSVEEILGIK